jgi:glycosyltransferase involved in cell wall biosynthesis
MSKLLVSVHMVTYNHEKYIAQAIESVLSQKTTFDIELVIGEDRSTDKTLEICTAYAEKLPTIVRIVSREQNYGSSKNFFDLFSHCRGKYIATCEGDDYWIDPYKLQKQVDLLESYPQSSMSVALIKTVNSANEEVTETPFINETLPLIYQKGLIKYFHTSTYVVRKKYIDEAIAKYPPLLINDTALCFLLIQMGPFVLLNEIVSVYRITDEGIWTGVNDLNKSYRHYALHRFFRKYHVLHRYFFHLKWEKKFLDIITLQDKDYRQKFRFRKYYVDTIFFAMKVYNKLFKMFRS